MNMSVMRMHGNDWECVRITHIQGGVGVIQGGYTLDDIHENVWLSQHEWTCLWWECMRMTENGMHENDWGWLRIAHIQGGGGGHSMLTYIVRHAWYCMRMHENDWESLIFKEGVVVILGWYTLYDMHDTVCVMIMHENEWECMRITHTQGGVWVILSWYAIHDIHENALYYLIMNEHVCDENAWEWLRMCENHSYSGRGVGHSKLICNRRHPWECILYYYNPSTYIIIILVYDYIIWILYDYYNEYMCLYFVYYQGNPGIVDKSGW